MSSLLDDITAPGRPEIHEVSAGIYAYVQPDGTWWINNHDQRLDHLDSRAFRAVLR